MTNTDKLPIPTYQPQVADGCLEWDREEPDSKFPGDWCAADDVRKLVARMAKLEEALREILNTERDAPGWMHKIAREALRDE